MRPKFINLFILAPKMGITAMVSIKHRVTGIIMFLLIPLMLFALDQSLHSSSFYILAHTLFQNMAIKIVYLLLIACFIFHALSGVRFLLLDVHVGTSKLASKRFSWVVIICSIVLLIVCGVLIW